MVNQERGYEIDPIIPFKEQECMDIINETDNNFIQWNKNKFKFSIESPLKLDISREIKFSQVSNILSILTTFLVSKFFKSREMSSLDFEKVLKDNLEFNLSSVDLDSHFNINLLIVVADVSFLRCSIMYDVKNEELNYIKSDIYSK